MTYDLEKSLGWVNHADLVEWFQGEKGGSQVRRFIPKEPGKSPEKRQMVSSRAAGATQCIPGQPGLMVRVFLRRRGQKVKGWGKRRKRVRTDLSPMNSLELPLLPQTEHRIKKSPLWIKRRKVSHQLISVWTKTLRVKGNLGRDHGLTGKPREVSIGAKKMGSSIRAQTHTER